ncbi:hypothetical protein IMSHALPRED_008565 [Imshaugia aleurites]|uniref:CBM-cenC domain-containing protein n=1 Tax=Imshaugia aleurites TaxID=172621 RepID=A0A8H3FS52_9LECA|nr:hypothetical protein IMSHALPRED_008565 [Imshaugia aleurites]
MLTFRTYFDACGDGFVGVKLNQAPVYTVDACDYGAGAFEDNTVNFTATVSPTNLRFEFEVSETTAVVKIDNVAVVPVSAPTAVSSSTAPAASCTSNIISNGGFESGAVSPWAVSAQVGNTASSVVKPGSTNAGGGAYAFSASLLGPQGVSSLTLSQVMATCAGTNYSVKVDYKFSSTALNDCSFKLQYPYKTSSGSETTPSALGTAGAWYTTFATFQAVSNADVLTMVFSCSNGQTDVIEVDNVVAAYYPYNAF